MSEKVIAVVVTYNRKKLLLECLEAILNQSYSVSKIILINNASTDGTEEELQKRGLLDNKIIQYERMDKNLGGAGGFYEGLKICQNIDCDWVWIMDDDTIPNEVCLEKLMLGKSTIESCGDKNKSEFSNKISFLASAVYGAEGEFMNVPVISDRPSVNGYPYWYANLSRGIVNISMATFVSILVNKHAINQCGLPCKDYFIWGDDSEYTRRLTTFYGDAYFIGDSIAVHKRIGAKSLSIDNEENMNRIGMFHYYYRNNFINEKYYKSNKYISFFKFLYGNVKALRYRGTKINRCRRKAILKGYWEGLTQYKKFAKYIDEQLKK